MTPPIFKNEIKECYGAAEKGGGTKSVFLCEIPGQSLAEKLFVMRILQLLTQSSTSRHDRTVLPKTWCKRLFMMPPFSLAAL